MEERNEINTDAHIQKRYEEAIEYYWRASRSNKLWYKLTRGLTIVLGALVTLVASLSSSTIIDQSPFYTAAFALGTPILAALLTIINGFSQGFQWGGTWQDMVLTAERLQGELDRYLITPPEDRNLAAEAAKLNEFIITESEGFFQRLLGGAKPWDENGKPDGRGNGE